MLCTWCAGTASLGIWLLLPWLRHLVMFRALSVSPSMIQIMKTINKIRSKDPDIYDTGKTWFTKGDGSINHNNGE